MVLIKISEKINVCIHKIQYIQTSIIIIEIRALKFQPY